MVRMETWDLTAVNAAPSKPEVLHSQRGAARVVALELPAGDSLEEHEVHEHAWLHVHHGAVEVAAGDGGQRIEAGGLVHWAPGERHVVRGIEDARLLLILAPWPGEGHPGARDPH
jgi:quercetin dioxygenase-like cupin family protein